MASTIPEADPPNEDDSPSVSGKPARLTPEVSDNRAVWQLAGPAVTLNLLQTINQFLDSFFLGHLKFNGQPDPAPLAAVAASSTLVFLLFSFGMALGTAPTAIVARAFGAGNKEELRTAAQKSIGFAVLVSLILMLVGFALTPVAQRVFVPDGADRVALLAGQYITIFILGLPAVYIIQTLAGCLRAIGDGKSPMVISAGQIGIHLILNLALIYPGYNVAGIQIPGAGLGLMGAAIALTASAWISAIVYLLFARTTPLAIRFNFRLPEMHWVQRFTRIAAPASLMAFLRVGSFGLLMSVLRQVPDAEYALAAMRIGINVEAVAFMPAFALMVSAQALVGQSLGRKDPDRAARLGWLAAHHSALVTVAVSVLLVLTAQPLVNFMLEGQPKEVAEIAIRYIWIVLATEVLFNYAMVLVGAMQGAGDTVRPVWLAIFALWIVRIPAAALLALPLIQLGPLSIPGFSLGAEGVWWAISISQSVNGIGAMILFKKGAWKTAKV